MKKLEYLYREIYQVIDPMAALTTSAQLRSSGMQGSGTLGDLMTFGLDQGWHAAVVICVQRYAATIKRYYEEFVNELKAGKYGN